ncbi:hypothetical protein FGG08_006641 [Glutinoglossum americanum]|uniref:Very long-chain fatty acid transport protein n=1 Tax=Glutinoglossum americanum TaxID=1670608 RepID=A0A9P8L0R2_9PEZI|nr:hypothetical protein FGG08_006641 [Glutinoglossum americanum]
MQVAVPLSIAVPAVTASLAYLNARTSFSYDWGLLSNFFRALVRIKIRERRDRVNVFYTLEEHAQSCYGDRTFMVYKGKEWSFKQTYEIVLKYGAWLKSKHGVKPREIVAMDFMNSPTFAFLWFGIWSIGAQPAFINYNLAGKPLLHCVKTSTARLLFVDEELDILTQEVVDAASSEDFRGPGRGGVEIVTFTADIESEVMNTQGFRAPDSDRGGRVATDMGILIYTSGTTGLPKPAIVSWNKCILGGAFAFNWLGLKRDDKMYTCMPLYHSSATLLGFLSMLTGGGTIVIGHKFSTKTFWKEVRESDATVIQYVGETCRYLLAAPPQRDPETGENLDKKHKVRTAFGNGLRPDVWDRFKERFGIGTVAEFYAATEGITGTWNMSCNDFSSGAIGRHGLLAQALLGSTTAIVEVDWSTEQPLRDPNTGLCKSVGRGQPGELLYKLDENNIQKKFQGYYNDKKATEGKILWDVLKKGDAYYRTGDVVRRDEQGRWYFNDRIGDTFRWKSENISTSEVSQTLGLHPSVLEANVYGIPLPHHDGRAGCAAVILSQPATPALLASIANYALTNLPRFAVPLFLRIMTEGGMQITGTNKQQKAIFREQGVDPEKCVEKVVWLKEERKEDGGVTTATYVPFERRDWEEMMGGRVRL